MKYKAKLIKDSNIDELSHKYCLISYEKYDLNNIESKAIIKLCCGHCFYYDYIIESYKITNRSSINRKRLCPYCRGNGGYLPLIKGKWIKGIHNKIKIKKPEDNKDKIIKNYYCAAILESGKNKGNICNCKTDNKYYNAFKKKYYCGRHKKFKD